MDQTAPPRESASEAAEAAVPARVDPIARLLGGAALLCAAIAVGNSALIERSGADQPMTVEEDSHSVAEGLGPEVSAGEDALLLVSLSALDRALATSDPFAYELAVAMQATSHIDEIAVLLDRLTAAAESGVRSRDALIAVWPAQMASVADIPARFGDALNRVLNYDPTRRTEMELLMEANAAIREGRLAPAVAAMSSLEGESAAAIGPWLSLARQRLAIDSEREELRRLMYLHVLSGQT